VRTNDTQNGDVILDKGSKNTQTELKREKQIVCLKGLSLFNEANKRSTQCLKVGAF